MNTLMVKTVIIGGGPSGANAAKYLAASKEDVLLIEKDLSFDKPCGGGLFFKAFDEFNIPQALIKRVVNTIDIISPKRKKVSVDISKHPLAVVHRQEFDKTLRELAVKSGAQLLKAKVVNIATNHNGIEISARQSDGSEITVYAKYAIVADGVNSSARRQLLGEYPSRVLTYYANLKGEESNTCQFWLGDDISPQHYAWIFPHYNGINIGLVANNKHRMQEFYNNFFKKAKIEVTLPKAKGYFIPHWKRIKLYKNNVFYVGDSASLVLPFTYEGIYYALKSGQLAAKAIIKNDPLLYEKSWNSLYLKKFKFLRTLQTIFLRNNWWANQMVRLYQNPKFQKSVIEYWSGSKKPEGVFKTLYKVVKVLVKYR